MDPRSIVTKFEFLCAIHHLPSANAVTSSSATEGLKVFFTARCLLDLGLQGEKHQQNARL